MERIWSSSADLQSSLGYQIRWFLPDLGCQSSSLKVIDECSVIVQCEEMSERDGVSPRSESKRTGKWKWLHLIFSIWEWLPQKTIFKEEHGGGRKKEAIVICTGFTNLNQIWGMFVHILFYSLKTITHETHAHMHKQLHTNISRCVLSHRCIHDWEIACYTKSNNPRE